jgi:hypothetical protein
MGTVDAGRLFLEALTLAGEAADLNAASNFDTTALNGLHSIQASPGRVLCRLPVAKRVQNRYSTLHGGCIGGRPVRPDLPHRAGQASDTCCELEAALCSPA